MNLRKYLHQLRMADHFIASLPKGPERTNVQSHISNELERLQKLLNVESTKGTNAEFETHDWLFCAEDAETPPDPWVAEGGGLCFNTAKRLPEK